MQVVSAEDGAAICAGRGRREPFDVALAGASSVDEYFADLIGRVPQLPPHLRRKEP